MPTRPYSIENLRASWPGFVAEVRRLFEPAEIAAHLKRMEQRDREQARDGSFDEEDDIFAETAAETETRRERFAMIKELLRQPQLGTA